MTQIQIDLQNELRDRLAKYGIEVFTLDTKELKTYKKVFEAIDALLEQQKDISEAQRTCVINITNVARVADICKSTLDHNEDIKAIIRSFRSEKPEETVPKSLYDRIVADRDSYKRKHESARKTELELFAANKLIEDKNREIKMLQDNQESLYNKIAALKDKDSLFKDMMDKYFPTIQGTMKSSS